MVRTAVRPGASAWFAVAWAAGKFVATAVGNDEREAAAALHRCLPAGVVPQKHAGPSRFLDSAVAMLAELEAGDEGNKRVALSADHLSEPMYRIYTLAAAIPIGFVSTYGAVARAAGSEARAVGRAMATNPLYPIVPCHRVVGSDLSLVGYGGKQDADALGAKLARLEAEARGELAAREIASPDPESAVAPLEVFPVEWLIRATREADERRLARIEAEKERKRIEAMQPRLF